ncbi:S1C family serine protease [Pseudonocardia spinosispora]|uniref:S1C family serine protease n=1 Tax=Pseudonocardia spinosispora TaxID=103441 RepID=UPI0003F5B411|nr:trypsin-like peptidase domain-containing protein [Pseudonocardia spinosispora]
MQEEHSAGAHDPASSAGQPPYSDRPMYGAHSGGTTPTAVYPAFGTPAPAPPRRTTSLVAIALVAGLVGGGLGFGGAYLVFNSAGVGATTLAGTADPMVGKPSDGSVAGAAAKAMPSTVDIRWRTNRGTVEGSGVILSAEGEVLTNNHVVDGASQGVQVTLADGSTHRASVVGTSPSYDLAVIRISGASGLTPATLGRSTDVSVGQPVVAIGSPEGLSGTVTSGIVSAMNRTVTASDGNGSGRVIYNGLQTDAPINPGNSGGPLVNLAGQVVGINSAIVGSNGSIGLGFAIPVDQARRVAQELISNGTATKPQLGVAGGESALGGATIGQVTPGSAAEAAGLRAGDVVTKVGSATVGDFTDLIARVGSYAPGQQVTLTVTGADGTAPREVPVTLGSMPDKQPTISDGDLSGLAELFGRGGN